MKSMGLLLSGISNELRDDFSERRMEIKIEAARRGMKTKNNAVLAQMITLKTRKNRSEIPPIKRTEPDLVDDVERSWCWA